MKTLGVAVIGLGVGEQHARAYLRSDGCSLRLVYDLDEARMDQILRELGEGEKANSLEAVLADKSVDVLSIASYDDMHFEQVVAALQAGKHVFVEKPLCRSMKELSEIKNVWQAKGNRHLGSNLVLRSAPLYQWLKQQIEAGCLGDVYAFDGDYLYGRLHKITDGWRKDVDDYSVIQGGAVHLVDLMLWLTGQKPAFVTATGNRICTRGTTFRYDDFVSATFQFPSGLIGRITANFGSVHRHQHVLRVFGTKGTFIYDDMGPRLHASRDASVTATMLDLSGLPSSKGDLIPDFVASIIKGESTHAKTQQEFDVICACVSADLAAKTSQSVQIEYL
jgi:predicted dehydrogenase